MNTFQHNVLEMCKKYSIITTCVINCQFVPHPRLPAIECAKIECEEFDYTRLKPSMWLADLGGGQVVPMVINNIKEETTIRTTIENCFTMMLAHLDRIEFS